MSNKAVTAKENKLQCTYHPHITVHLQVGVPGVSHANFTNGLNEWTDIWTTEGMEEGTEG